MNLYGFFFSDGKWGLAKGGRKRERIKLAKQHNALVGVVKHAYSYGSPSGWDAPTFRTTMDFLADFRLPATYDRFRIAGR